jgi:hypothetical protein
MKISPLPRMVLRYNGVTNLPGISTAGSQMNDYSTIIHAKRSGIDIVFDIG